METTTEYNQQCVVNYVILEDFIKQVGTSCENTSMTRKHNLKSEHHLA